MRKPPTTVRREITPEQAAEVLGIDLVLLERRMNAGVLPYHEQDGKITFNLNHVLELKRKEEARDSSMVEISDAMEGIDKPPVQ